MNDDTMSSKNIEIMSGTEKEYTLKSNDIITPVKATDQQTNEQNNSEKKPQ